MVSQQKPCYYIDRKFLVEQHLGLTLTRTVFGISLSLILINMAAIMERADENLLPAVYKEVSETFNAGPTDLGYLTFILRFVQALSSPLAGVLVLPIVIPALQSFVADSYTDGARGTGFGMLSLVGSVGGIGGSALATIMAGQEYWGIPGWRCAFIMMALSSSVIALLVYLFVIDPRKLHKHTSHEMAEGSERRMLVYHRFGQSWRAMKIVMRLKTFQFIVLQGIVGSLPWTAMVFFTMWFELIGFDHNKTAALLSLFAIGCAMRSLLGGLIGERISRIYPSRGRIMGAQFSAFMGVCFSWFLLVVIPQSVSSWPTFAVTLFFMGLMISWNGSCANNPMFAEIVPTQHRTMIYAFDHAFEGSFSSFAARSIKEALALSRGLVSMMCVPYALCSLFYTPLYWFYKQDRESAKNAERARDGVSRCL
ncbi:hypothetical protein MKX01_004090 [Papaver californicum]|nr:hypothetical protein MKX01_004090 [Papaver californicum]